MSEHSSPSPSHNDTQKPFSHSVARGALLTVGLLAVLTGAADIVTRAARAAFPDNAAAVAFAPALAALPQEAIVPTHLDIPSIGVHANVELVEKKADGSMGTPHNFVDVGWYSLGVKPGNPGNAVIDGHVNNALTTSGVFEHLGQLKQGDSMTVSDALGHTLTYSVDSVESYDAATAPLQNIFATSGPSKLVLITCDGEWVQDEHSFNRRLVVYATLLSSAR